MGLLIRQGRFDDAIETGRHTFDDLYDGNLLQSTMILLAAQARHDKALELTEGRSPEFLAENASWLRSNRWWLMGEAGRAREAIEEIEALPAGEVDDRELTIAWLLAQDSRVEQAIARLRPLPGKRAATDLAELLIRQTRFAEAVAVIPDVAAQREEERRFWTDRTEQKEMAPSDRGDPPEATGRRQSGAAARRRGQYWIPVTRPFPAVHDLGSLARLLQAQGATVPAHAGCLNWFSRGGRAAPRLGCQN
jgi:hypothetical protein